MANKNQQINKLKRQLENLDDLEVVLEKLFTTIDEEKKKRKTKSSHTITTEEVATIINAVAAPPILEDERQYDLLHTPGCPWLYKNNEDTRPFAATTTIKSSPVSPSVRPPKGKNIALLKELHQESLKQISEDLNCSSSDSLPSPSHRDEANIAAETLETTTTVFTEEFPPQNANDVDGDIIMENSPIDDYDNDNSSDYVPNANEPDNDYDEEDDNNDDSDDDKETAENSPPPLPPKAKYRIKLEYWKKNRHINEHEIVSTIHVPYLSPTRENIRVFNK